ncbi:TIGR04551 family protein [Haliangium sp.]|uniref:TIGR04551 family protein n=1 Tax=Haliangium sp. TaxID=2663208 RepID=UPI003D105943
MTLRAATTPAFGLMLAVLLAWGSAGDAWAQVGPNPLPPTSAGGATDKKPGVAEQADEPPTALPSPPVLPPVKSERKRYQLIELDGYYRFRTDWFKNFHLGFDDLGPGGAPFPRPLSCAVEGGPCGDTLKSANMRLRLEPTINIAETTKVHLQIDVLDNVVLGSTPVTRVSPGSGAGIDLPTGFDDNQAPPEAGFNDYADSIRVKRAWAEVETSLGTFTFGRQAWHWGLGIYANSGGRDPFSGVYDTDKNFGDTVDRASFRARVPGTNIDASLAMDWAATSPTLGQNGLYLDEAGLYQGRVGGPGFDLEDSDDVYQWTFSLVRFDEPALFRERIERGEWAFNYGGFVVYRTQDNDTLPPADGDEGLADRFVRRGLATYTPDVWLRLGKDKLLVELEAAFTLGSIDNVSDLEPSRTGSVDIRRFGAVARASYEALDGDMHLRFEGGIATGDNAQNTPAGAIHVGNQRLLDPDNSNTLTAFQFDYDYHIDLILFRELIGTVTNAVYARPSLYYQISEAIQAELAAVISGPVSAEATPGAASKVYGVELDAEVGYRAGGFFAGVAGGALFPFGALEHPAGATFGVPNTDGDPDNSGSADNAYTIQTRLVLEF